MSLFLCAIWKRNLFLKAVDSVCHHCHWSFGFCHSAVTSFPPQYRFLMILLSILMRTIQNVLVSHQSVHNFVPLQTFFIFLFKMEVQWNPVHSYYISQTSPTHTQWQTEDVRFLNFLTNAHTFKRGCALLLMNKQALYITSMHLWGQRSCFNLTFSGQ